MSSSAASPNAGRHLGRRGLSFRKPSRSESRKLSLGASAHRRRQEEEELHKTCCNACLDFGLPEELSLQEIECLDKFRLVMRTSKFGLAWEVVDVLLSIASVGIFIAQTCKCHKRKQARHGQQAFTYVRPSLLATAWS